MGTPNIILLLCQYYVPLASTHVHIILWPLCPNEVRSLLGVPLILHGFVNIQKCHFSLPDLY